MNRSDRLVCLAAIAGAHGVRGAFRLKTFTAGEQAAASYGPLRTEDGSRRLTLKIVRVLKPGLALATAKEISTREDAEALAGTKLYVARAALPAVEDENEFYHEDLIGLAVVDEAGASQGRVAAVHNFGAGDILELKDRPGGAKPALIPFTRAAVPEVDLAAGRLIVVAALLEGVREGPILSDATGEIVSDDPEVALAAMREEDA